MILHLKCPPPSFVVLIKLCWKQLKIRTYTCTTICDHSSSYSLLMLVVVVFLRFHTFSVALFIHISLSEIFFAFYMTSGWQNFQAFTPHCQKLQVSHSDSKFKLPFMFPFSLSHPRFFPALSMLFSIILSRNTSLSLPIFCTDIGQHGFLCF